MALTRSDKDDIKEMLNTAIEHIKEVQAEVMKNVNGTLVRIEAQTTKTNGRVTALEKTLPHVAENCPNKPILDKLNEHYMETKGASKWGRTLLNIAVSFISAVVGFLTALKFLS